MNILHFLTPKSEVAYLYDDFSLRQALEKMEYHQYSAIPIITREGRYVGVITEGDLLWHVKNQDFMNLRMAEEEPLSEVHRRTNAQAVGVGTSIEDLVVSAMNQNFGPVVDDRDLFIGIVKRKEIIRYCYELAFPGKTVDEGQLWPVINRKRQPVRERE